MKMKYCPYCGTELQLGTVSFCHECGKSLKEMRDGALEPFVVRKAPEKEEPKRDVEWIIPHREKKKVNKSTYDGYYDDIVPEDGMVHEQPRTDNSMMLKIGLIIGGVVIVAIACIVALVLL